jgi:ABC-2 type transport system ATP-binding protein
MLMPHQSMRARLCLPQPVDQYLPTCSSVICVLVVALEFRSASKRFGDGTLALADVSWAVAEGSRVCLLGPNGAGKSTSIRLLQGALGPTSGSVELLGAAVGGDGYEEARRRTGIMPQGPGMYPDLTAGEYLQLAAMLYRARPDGAVEAFGLGPHLGTRMSQLSGGFQRRLLLAAAVFAGPEVLLLDEPTVGLDPVAAKDVHEYLLHLMQGRTVLLCTHNLAEAQSLCDHVVILRGGRVVLQGTLGELRRRARPRLMLTARQGVRPLLEELNGMASRAWVTGESVLMETTDPREEAPVLLRRLLAAGLDIWECTPVQPTLEDLFLDAVR